MTLLGDLVESARKQQGRTQAEVAKQIGLASAKLGEKLKGGSRHLQPEELIRLIAELDLPVEQSFVAWAQLESQRVLDQLHGKAERVGREGARSLADLAGAVAPRVRAASHLTLADFPFDDEPWCVITGDRREDPPKYLGDLLAYSVSTADLMNLPSLELPKGSTVRSDKILSVTCGTGETGSATSVPMLMGEQVIVRVSGSNGAEGSYTIVFQGPGGPVPISPDPAEIEGIVRTPGFNTVTAVTPSAGAGPFEYLFEGNPSGNPLFPHSGWQSSSTFAFSVSGSSLYDQRVTVRDVFGMETEPSAIETITNLPVGPTVLIPEVNTITMDIDVGSGNSSPSEYSIQCASSPDPTWDAKFVAVGGAGNLGVPTNEAGASWLSFQDWDDIEAAILDPGTEYCWHIRARNALSEVSAFGPIGCATTNGGP